MNVNEEVRLDELLDPKVIKSGETAEQSFAMMA